MWLLSLSKEWLNMLSSLSLPAPSLLLTPFLFPSLSYMSPNFFPSPSLSLSSLCLSLFPSLLCLYPLSSRPQINFLLYEACHMA